MSAFGLSGFATTEEVEVEVYTSAYLVTGTIRSAFRRVAELLNQVPSAHFAIDDATVTEHSDRKGAASMRTASALVSLDEVLVIVAPGLSGQPGTEMRIEKQPAQATLSIPPFRLEGTVYVPVGTRPADGLLNVGERFVPMTDVQVTSSAFPHLARKVEVLAMRRDRAHVVVVSQREPPKG